MTCEGCILFPSATAEGMAMSIQQNSSSPCLSRPVNLQVPTYALRTLEVLEDAGFEAWIVGGWVRDALRGSFAHDIDITTSATWQQSKAAFEAADIPVHETGIAYGTITAVVEKHPIEVTTYRCDGEYLDGRRPDSVQFVSRIEEDLARRDFTINAMAYHPKRGLLDLYGGQEDLSARVIRAVGEPKVRFTEDALRMLRALRFACRLSFSIEEKTHQALTECAPLLSQVASERIGSEVAQIVEAGHIAHAIKLGFPVLAVAIPELLPLQNFDQRSPYHAYDVLEHTARVCSATEAFTAGTATPALRWAALLHDIAKPEMFSTDADGRGHFYGHPEKGAVVAKALLKRLTFSQHLSNEVCALVALHDFDVEVTTSSLRHMVALLAEASRSNGIALAYDLLTLKQADALAKANPYRSYAVTLEAMRTLLLQEVKVGMVQSPQELCVSGADIMEALSLQPGPSVGMCQRKLFKAYLSGQVDNKKEDLLALLTKGNW